MKEIVRAELKKSINYQTYGASVEVEIEYQDYGERVMLVDSIYKRLRSDLKRQMIIDGVKEE